MGAEAAPGGPAFLVGGGKLGALTRSHDWPSSPLGNPASWPQPLRTIMGVLLAANQPMFVAWGPERTLLYNDPYAEILGNKHPAALGRPLLDVWSEIHDDLLPIVERAYAGEPVHMDDIAFVLHRRGHPEEAHFAFSYTPVRDEAGAVAGFFCPCVETTAQVFAERRQAFRLALEDRLRDLADPRDVTGAAAEVLGRHFGAVRAGYAEVEADGSHTLVAGDWCAGGAASVAGRHRLSDFGPAFAADYAAGRIVAVDDVATDPRSAGTPAVAAHAGHGVRALAVVPLVKAGRLAALLFVHMAAPRRWAQADLSLISDVAERTWAAIGRARAEAGLRGSEARLRAAIEASEAGTFHWDIRTNALVWDEALDKLFGLAPGQTARSLDRFVAMVHPDDRAGVTAACQACAASGADFGMEFRVVRPDGEVRWLYDRGKTLPGADGRPATMTGACVDVTERRRAEERLRENEEQLRLATEAAEVGLWDLDPRSDTLFWPPRVKAMFGISSDQPISMADFYAGVHPDDAAATGEAFAAALDPVRRALYDVEYRTVGKEDGIVRWVAAKGRGVFDAEGRCTRILGTAIDITARKATEQALRELNETLEQRVAEVAADLDRTWRNASDIFVVIDGNGVFRRVNPAATAVLGWSEGELVGRSVFDFIHDEDKPASVAALEHARGDVLPTFENRYRTKDGGLRTVSWLASPEGAFIYAYGRDVTTERGRQAELEAAQDALRQSQKMEAVGQLTGGLAHDFNNLLAGISGSLELLQARVAQGRIGDLERYLVAAQGAAKRAAALTHRLLAFSRRQTLDPRPTDANRLVAGMEELVRRTMGPEVVVEVVAAGGLWTTLVDPNQLENALLNLCINARDAMPGGGRLTIETGNRWLDGRAARERDLQPGQYVSLCVSDTGDGMVPEVVALAFDPFYTTKPIGMGTGLGLSMVYGFVRQSGGQARIYSEPGQGTMVCLYLPRHHGDAADPDGPGEPADAPRAEAGETVLVVDDEPTVRMLVTEVLHDLGYTAIEAADGPSGLRVLQSNTRIDLLVTDVGLPGGMNGRQVADAARVARPGLKVLFITGYAENAVLSHGHLDPGMHVMTKPFALDALASRIRELIAGT